ncbi:inositol monophosphatase 2 [Rhipicephalus sanguineus]|uniref:inositol monophosphatase 2 n=1 Tax=Rhipicephalus sanguineus TaxID=34632 RepID=UPI0020C4730E|nr:inositol monophosphatase 2 [Rhipicephalus sanguineus]
MVTDQDIERFFCKALELVKESGALVQRAFGEGKQVETKSEFTDLVTQYDRQVEQLLIGKLREEYPNHKFIGEESVAAGIKSELTNDPTWIIDPIDGTMNFVHGFPVVAVSVALAVQKEIVVGIVYNPALDKMYTAVKGHGSFCNGTRLNVSGQNEISKALIISEVGSSRDPGHMQFVFRNMHNLMQKAQGLRCLGSTAVNMCFVASGEADAFYEFGMHVWDMAAAALIVTEAGGVVMDTQGVGPLNLMHRRVLCASSHALANTISQILEHVQLESD